MILELSFSSWGSKAIVLISDTVLSFEPSKQMETNLTSWVLLEVTLAEELPW